jgi:hypothetical protein
VPSRCARAAARHTSRGWQPASTPPAPSPTIPAARALPPPQCLCKDPQQRPTARQLLTHPWVRGHLDWEPVEDWDDPIPNIDFGYYRVGVAGDDPEGESDEGAAVRGR